MKTGEAIRDTAFVLGGAATVWGIHFLSIPAAWIVGGLSMMYLAWATVSEDEAPLTEHMRHDQTQSENAAEAPRSSNEREVRFHQRDRVSRHPNTESHATNGTLIPSKPWKAFVPPAGKTERPPIPAAWPRDQLAGGFRSMWSKLTAWR